MDRLDPSPLTASQTAARLPYTALADEIERLLADPAVHVPARLVQGLPGGGSLFVMPALDGRIAMTKLITFTPANAGTTRPAIQGDVVVFDIATGERTLVLDGPTVTARRTAALSLLAARQLAHAPQGPLLIVGAGAQGRAHLEAFAEGLAIEEVRIASGSAASADALAGHARGLGLRARTVEDPNDHLADCPLVVTCTPAGAVVLTGLPREDAFVVAVGAFTPQMVELSQAFCEHCAAHGNVVLDTPDATHEAGDLIQAGLDLLTFPTLDELLAEEAAVGPGPVLFKSCGWAGWDLAAARLATRPQAR